MRTNTIIKVKYEDKFVRIHNSIARNPKLSLKAKGLLLIIMSLPDDWVLHISQLPQFCEDSKTSVRTAFKELEKNGFILKVEIRDEKGRFKGNNYLAYPESQTIEDLKIESSVSTKNTNGSPHTDFPHTDNPHTDFPHTDNRTLQRKNTTFSTKKKNNKEKCDKEKAVYIPINVAFNLVANGTTIYKSQVTEETYKSLFSVYGADEQGNINNNPSSNRT